MVCDEEDGSTTAAIIWDQKETLLHPCSSEKLNTRDFEEPENPLQNSSLSIFSPPDSTCTLIFASFYKLLGVGGLSKNTEAGQN